MSATPEQIHAKLSHRHRRGRPLDRKYARCSPKRCARRRRRGGGRVSRPFAAPHSRFAAPVDGQAQGPRRDHAGPAIDQYPRPRHRDDAAHAPGSTIWVLPASCTRRPGLGIPRIPDGRTRRAVIRGFNIVTAIISPSSATADPAAVIPMHTPEEAIAELEFVTKRDSAQVPCSAAASPVRSRLTKEWAAKDPSGRAACGVL